MSSSEISPLYINPDDDRAGVEALIRKSEGEKLLLILAGQPSSNLDIIDLQLLNRMARRKGKWLAIATRNPSLRDAADYLGIPHFRTPAQARRADWSLNSPNNGKETPAFAPDQQLAMNRQHQPQRYHPVKTAELQWQWALVLLPVLLAAMVMLLFFSRATITIEPIPQTQSLPLEVTASSTVRAATLIGEIPLHTRSTILEGTITGTATGTLSFPEGYAEGFLTVTNLTTEALNIPAGLTVQTLDVQPVQFVTNTAVNLAPAGEDGESSRVSITARLPGREGNVTAGQIRAVVGQYGSSVAVNNTGAMFGGYNRFVNTPAEKDLEALRLSLIEQLLSEAQTNYITQMEADNLVLLPETIQMDEILSEEAVPSLGEPAEEFHLTLRVRFTVNYLDPLDLEPVATQLLDANIDAEYSPVEDSLTLTPVGAPIANDDGTYQWMVFLYRELLPDLTQLELQPFAGQPRKHLTNWLAQNYPDIDQITINSQPRFWWWLPILPQRMEVIIL